MTPSPVAAGRSAHSATDGIGLPRVGLGVIPLLADQPRHRPAQVAGFLQPRDHRRKIPPRPPAELAARQRVVVDAVDRGGHAPAAAGVFVLPSPCPLGGDRGGVRAQPGRVVAPERGRRADHIEAEADRRRAFGGQEMGVDHVLDRDAAVEKLVRLQIVGGERRPRVRIIVGLGKEARRPQRDRGQPFVAPKEPAEVLRRGLGDAVDVFRDGGHRLVDPRRGRARRGLERIAEGAGRRGHHEGLDAGPRRLFEQDQRASHVGLDERLASMRADMRLMQRGRVQDRPHALHRPGDHGSVRNRADEVGEGRGQHVEPKHGAALGAKRPHERLAKVA